MPRGAKILLIGGSLAAAGCATSTHLQVRPVGQTRASSPAAGGLLGEARAQLALGNVGLALESFRTLQRQQPNGAEAYEGIADCYEAMGRFDLARTNFEFALAYAPNNPGLLKDLAGSLEQLGEHEQAGEVRAEAVRLSSAPARPSPSQQTLITPVGVPRVASATLKLPEARRVRAPQNKLAQTLPGAHSTAKVSVAAALPAVLASAPLPPARRSIPAPVVNAPKPVVAVQLVAATAVPQIIVSPAAAKSPPELPPPVRMHPDEHLALATPAQRDSSPVEQGPRLERASRGEVLLITAPQHPQLAQVDRRIPNADALARETPPQRPAVPPRQRAVMLAATQVRWLPLKALEPSNVQLLNAARSQGLAAQSRNVLADRGWRRLAIGNAREVRQHSLVLYGPTRMHLATRLAAQFRCNAVKVAGLKSVVVLLGRDAVRHGSPSYRRA